MWIEINTATGLVTGMSMREHRSERRLQLPHFDEDEFPAAVLAYEAPTSLGEDWRSFTVNIDGDYYRLPAPVGELLKNGWALPHQDITLSPILDGSGFAMRLNRGEQLMWVGIANYDAEHRLVIHSFAVWVEFDFTESEGAFPFALPGGIGEQSTLIEMVGVFGMPDDRREEEGLRTYYFGEEYAGIRVTVDMESGEIQRLRVTNYPESLEVLELPMPEPAGREIAIVRLFAVIALVFAGGVGALWHPFLW